MAIANRWAVRNVAKATFYSATTGKMLTFLENLKSSDIQVSSETVYARGGDGNPKLIGFSSNKEVKVNLSSAIFDNRAMALLTGNSIVTAATEVYRREVLTSTSDALTLSATPKNSELVGLYLLGSDGVESDEYTKVVSAPTVKQYSLSSKSVTLPTDTTDGTQFVVYYIVTSADTTQTLTVSSDKFPSAFKLVLEVLVTDFATKTLYPAQITIPSAKMEDSWQLSFKPDGDPEPLALPIEVLKPANSNDMFTLKVYDSAALT
jgi:hypothetical protein